MALQVEQSMQDTFSVNESSYCFKKASGKVNKMAVSALKGANDKEQYSQGAEEAGSTSDGSLTQLSVGPAALAQLMIYKAIDLYATVIGLQSEERSNMVNAQVSCAQSQATETVAEGDASFWAGLASGLATIGGAAASLVAYKVVDNNINGDTKTQMEELQPEIKQMDVVDENLTSGRPADIQGNGASKNKVESLMEEFRRHDYTNAQPDENLSEEGKAEHKQNVEDAIGALKGDENWKAEFNKRFEVRNQKMNMLSTKQSTASNYTNMLSQIFNSFGNAGSSFAQADGQKKSALHRAAASLDGTSTQMAGGSASEFAQAASKAYDAQVQEVQMLEKIHQANSVNG